MRPLLLAAALTALTPLPAFAGVCETLNPDWVAGSSVSLLQQTISMLAMPVSLLLLIASAVMFRLRAQWGALAVIIGWASWITALTTQTAIAARRAAQLEGCAASPALFFAIAVAVCIGLVLYTSPIRGRDT